MHKTYTSIQPVLEYSPLLVLIFTIFHVKATSYLSKHFIHLRVCGACASHNLYIMFSSDGPLQGLDSALLPDSCGGQSHQSGSGLPHTPSAKRMSRVHAFVVHRYKLLHHIAPYAHNNKPRLRVTVSTLNCITQVLWKGKTMHCWDYLWMIWTLASIYFADRQLTCCQNEACSNWVQCFWSFQDMHTTEPIAVAKIWPDAFKV